MPSPRRANRPSSRLTLLTVACLCLGGVLVTCGKDRGPSRLEAPKEGVVGRVTEVQGEVTWSLGAQGQRTALRVGDEIRAEWTLHTATGAALAVQLRNGHRWSLTEDQSKQVSTVAALTLPPVREGALTRVADLGGKKGTDRTSAAGLYHERTVGTKASPTSGEALADSEPKDAEQGDKRLDESPGALRPDNDKKATPDSAGASPSPPGAPKAAGGTVGRQPKLAERGVTRQTRPPKRAPEKALNGLFGSRGLGAPIKGSGGAANVGRGGVGQGGAGAGPGAGTGGFGVKSGQGRYGSGRKSEPVSRPMGTDGKLRQGQSRAPAPPPPPVTTPAPRRPVPQAKAEDAPKTESRTEGKESAQSAAPPAAQVQAALSAKRAGIAEVLKKQGLRGAQQLTLQVDGATGRVLAVTIGGRKPDDAACKAVLQALHGVSLPRAANPYLAKLEVTIP